jgi:hypothetical protein
MRRTESNARVVPWLPPVAVWIAFSIAVALQIVWGPEGWAGRVLFWLSALAWLAALYALGRSARR